MGLTFKENVAHLRNSRSIDLSRRLTELGHDVAIADPHDDGDEVEALYGCELSHPGDGAYDLVIGAVRHDEHGSTDHSGLEQLLAPGGTLAHIKGKCAATSLPCRPITGLSDR